MNPKTLNANMTIAIFHGLGTSVWVLPESWFLWNGSKDLEHTLVDRHGLHDSDIGNFRPLYTLTRSDLRDANIMRDVIIVSEASSF